MANPAVASRPDSARITPMVAQVPPVLTARLARASLRGTGDAARRSVRPPPRSRSPNMPGPFRPATELMVQYATYHRDRRNIATHFFGIPLIVFAIGVFLARPQFDLGPLHFTAAAV